jgi:predicted subunit of tRNA(5-methylaminomethyl-2-thiouridylate) methyltransferase
MPAAGPKRCDRPRDGYDEVMTPKDPDPGVQHAAQVTIQEIVDRLATTHRGEDPEVTRAALAQAIADAGLPEQPEKWVSDTATEVAAGRQVVIDRTRRDEDDPRR